MSAFSHAAISSARESRDAYETNSRL